MSNENTKDNARDEVRVLKDNTELKARMNAAYGPIGLAPAQHVTQLEAALIVAFNALFDDGIPRDHRGAAFSPLECLLIAELFNSLPSASDVVTESDDAQFDLFDDGIPRDHRGAAIDPECTHGRKFSDLCPACDSDARERELRQREEMAFASPTNDEAQGRADAMSDEQNRHRGLGDAGPFVDGVQSDRQ